MKVCIVASGDFFSDYGGGQVYVRNIVDELARHSDVSTTVISFNKNIQPSVKDYRGISVYQVNSDNSLCDALKQLNPDVVHANGEKLITSRICKQLNIPCVVTAHHGGIVCPAGTLLNTDDEICQIPADYSHCFKCYLRHTPTGLLWYPLLKRISQKLYIKLGNRLKRLPFVPFISPIGETAMIVSQKLQDWQELSDNATHFIAPSNAIADALKRNGCPQEKISVIPHGIPNSEFRTSNYESTHSQFTIHNSQLIKFYYVGRINYVKGIHILCQAFASIDNPNIELHLIGGTGNKSEQRYENKLKKKYRKDKRIIWHGKLPFEQMTELIKDYHCLIHPAIYLEVFGLNISEAIAQNKYVIATRCGGAEMQIHDDEEGILVKPNNPMELKDAMIRYIKAPKQSTAIVESIETHTQKLINLYSKLL